MGQSVDGHFFRVFLTYMFFSSLAQPNLMHPSSSRCSFSVCSRGLLVRGRRWVLVRGSSLSQDECDLAAYVL